MSNNSSEKQSSTTSFKVERTPLTKNQLTPIIIFGLAFLAIIILFWAARPKTAHAAEPIHSTCGQVKESTITSPGHLPWEVEVNFSPQGQLKMRTNIEVDFIAGKTYRIFYRDTLVNIADSLKTVRYYQGAIRLGNCGPRMASAD